MSGESKSPAPTLRRGWVLYNLQYVHPRRFSLQGGAVVPHGARVFIAGVVFARNYSSG